MMSKEVIELQKRRNRELSSIAEVSEWSPEYPNAASLELRDGFICGAEMAGLRDIPAYLVSWAIDRAILAGKQPKSAGRVFADVYYKIQQRRKPRGGYGSPTAYLLAVYEEELKR